MRSGSGVSFVDASSSVLRQGADESGCADTREAALARVFAALSDPLRLRIVRRIALEGELGCGQIDHGLSSSTVSHHCKVLREAGIVVSTPVGNQRVLTLRPEFECDYQGLLASIVRRGSAAPGGD